MTGVRIAAGGADRRGGAWRRTVFLLALGLLVLWPDPVRAADQAVIIMYHRFNEQDYPSTNIRLEQFDEHLAELTSGKYNVMALPDIVAALKAGKDLPDRTVGITVDDAYASVYEHGWPRLKKAGLPFTLFVATEPVDDGLKGIMTWDQIRELKAQGVTIGHHTVSHAHMAGAPADANLREFEEASRRFQAELGEVPGIFAYPYGEASLRLEAMARNQGFVAAFGQHSGVAHPSLGLFYLPRFAMNETFGGIGRFRLAVNALALPVTDVTPADQLITENNPPAMGFTLIPPGPKALDRIACFASHEGRARLERLGDVRFEIRVTRPFPEGRGRINCTVPGPDGRWYWLGRQFFIAK
ncbi:MAG: chitin deacetylase [Rhodospirillales bacterium CG15_BIG_FIL_POST_REV_8_21_14_020_66_15]|nr:MAG: chitin deacetylase [Rhodospirillales bacterium CG15_BIG_FIL_POST_REV_8_21_14_020_66_15]